MHWSHLYLRSSHNSHVGTFLQNIVGSGYFVAEMGSTRLLLDQHGNLPVSAAYTPILPHKPCNFIGEIIESAISAAKITLCNRFHFQTLNNTQLSTDVKHCTIQYMYVQWCTMGRHMYEPYYYYNAYFV